MQPNTTFIAGNIEVRCNTDVMTINTFAGQPAQQVVRGQTLDIIIKDLPGDVAQAVLKLIHPVFPALNEFFGPPETKSPLAPARPDPRGSPARMREKEVVAKLKLRMYMRELIRTLASRDGKQTALELLQSHGYERLADVRPDDYGDIISDCKDMLGSTMSIDEAERKYRERMKNWQKMKEIAEDEARAKFLKGEFGTGESPVDKPAEAVQKARDPAFNREIDFE